MTARRLLTRREFVAYAAAGAGAVACGGLTGTSGDKELAKPNVLFIFADQMRASALGCMGNDSIKTPNLDSLAEQGVLFTNAFSSAPVCSPYRAQLMTGTYSHVNGVVRNGMKLAESHRCIAEVFKDAGYATGYIGKWHLDGTPATAEGAQRPWGFVPPGEARQGWDYWAVLEPYLHQYFDTLYYRDADQPIHIKGYEPDTHTDLAIEYMKMNKSNPFLMMLSWGPPHPPYQPPQEYAVYDPATIPLRPNVPKKFEEVAKREIADYYGLITSLDANIGRISDALDELGIADKTIVCFTSDHGDMLYSQGQQAKQRPWEESIHIPFIMRYPGTIRPNQKQDILYNSVDVMPTLLGLCGLPVPDDVQGSNLSSLILSGRGREPDSAYFAITSYWVGGPRWDWRGVRTKEWMYATSPFGGWVLYNLIDDPYELRNLMGNLKYKKEAVRLRRLLNRWMAKTGDEFKIFELK
jgi:arylsulfatase A-like enzyme